MKEKDCCTWFYFGTRWLLSMGVLAGSFGTALRAQDIHIKVLDGRNGHPLANMCLNVSIGTWHGADLLAPTNKDGLIVLHVGSGAVSAEVPSGARCLGGFPTRAELPQGEDRITPASGGNDCQPFQKHQVNTPPSYSMHEILQTVLWQKTSAESSESKRNRES